jgi:3-phosphoshikimate 1-carboxyvinyltransferase
MKIAPAISIRGTVELPGDKSVSHRAAMIAAVAEGRTEIKNYSPSADCRSTLDCLLSLGVGIERNGRVVSIEGRGLSGLRAPSGPLECGNSGTTMRLLAGLLAGQPFDAILTGDASLSKRPMRRIIEPLERMGAFVGSKGGCPPLAFQGRRALRPISYSPSVASAQVKSCALLAGLFAQGETSVTEPVQTRDHTERLLRWFGGCVTVDGPIVSVSGDQQLIARDVVVHGDISAAAFFMAAAACLDGSDINFTNVGLNPTRVAMIDVLREVGAEVEIAGLQEDSNEPVGSLRVHGRARGDATLVISGERSAALIDELPVLAVLGTRLPGGLEVRDAAELRVKETDRIDAIAGNLRRMGAAIEVFDDGYRVEPSDLRGARVDAFGDHRIAMAMAIAGLLANGETEIDGAECVDVSFPGFFDVLRSVVS